jgi:tRNA (guanine-N7-)-methyltransferase
MSSISAIMKFAKIQFPTSWENRVPAFKDGILYVPGYYMNHEAWEGKDEWMRALSCFPEICVEYCSGTGAWIADKAAKNPKALWISVEKRLDRVQKIFEKKQKFALANLFIVCGEALTFTRYYLQLGALDRIFVNFPDPWPKDRHAKHRLIETAFVEEIARVVRIGGEATFVTDDARYSAQMIQKMLGSSYWKALFAEPYYKTTWPVDGFSDQTSYGSSYFESLWRQKGREIRYMKFNRLETYGS